MKKDVPSSRSPAAGLSTDKKRALKSGLQKLYPPAEGDAFEPLLKALAKAQRKK